MFYLCEEKPTAYRNIRSQSFCYSYSIKIIFIPSNLFCWRAKQQCNVYQNSINHTWSFVLSFSAAPGDEKDQFLSGSSTGGQDDCEERETASTFQHTEICQCQYLPNIMKPIVMDEPKHYILILT